MYFTELGLLWYSDYGQVWFESKIDKHFQANPQNRIFSNCALLVKIFHLLNGHSCRGQKNLFIILHFPTCLHFYQIITLTMILFSYVLFYVM